MHSVSGAGHRQRSEAAKRPRGPRRPRLVTDSPTPSGITTYRRAATTEDPVASELLLLGRTSTLLGEARKAEAWTATTTLHRDAIAQVRQIRAMMSARSESAAMDEAGQIALLQSALREMSPEERRSLLAVV